MFASALQAAHKLLTEDSTSAPKDLDLVSFSESLPAVGDYSLEQLHDEICTKQIQQEKDERPNLLVIQRVLSDITQLHNRESGKTDEHNLEKIARWIAKAILPSSNLIAHDEMPETPKSEARQRAILNARRKGELGMRALNVAYEISPLAIRSGPSIMLCILGFTSLLDSWTTPNSVSLANSLLKGPIIPADMGLEGDFIIDWLLKGFIQPLFSKSRPEGITAAGRKAMPSSAPRKPFDVNELEKASRPWKYDVPHAVAVFNWAVENVEPTSITENLGSFVPPLLILLDDVSTPIRHRALLILPKFFSALNPKLLSQTGLGSVFEDAILPVLLYLPTLTPVDESLLLLPAAYDSLFVLCSVRYITTSSSSESGKGISVITSKSTSQSRTDTDISPTNRLAFLDRVMRQGILTGYLHASNHPAIVKLLLEELSIMIPLLGIHVVKHLSHILPIITTVLTDVFSTIPLLSAATNTLQVLILNAWPRMSDQSHRMEIVRALVLCWQGLESDAGVKEGRGDMKGTLESVEALRKELVITGKLLGKAVDGDGSVDFAGELEPLLRADPSLRPLFGFEKIV